MASNLTEKAIAAARGSDLGDLLEHIAWTETLRPAMLSYRDVLSSQLVQATLGQPIETKTAAGTVVQISKEQIAGQIYGIQWMMDFVERTLKNGKRSLDDLKRLGVSVPL